MTAFWWVRLPRSATRFSPRLATLLVDGHYLTGVPVLAGALPLLAFGGGFALSATHSGYDLTMLESLPVLIYLLAVGAVSTQLGIAALFGLIMGDLALGSSVYREITSSNDLARVGGARVIEYLWLTGLTVAIPSMARCSAMLIATSGILHSGKRWLSAWLPGAAVLGALVGLWTQMAPLAVQPLVTWRSSYDAGALRNVVTAMDGRVSLLVGAAILAFSLRILLWASVGLSERGRQRVVTFENRLLSDFRKAPRDRAVDGYRSPSSLPASACSRAQASCPSGGKPES